jgi:3',5'-cyclic AMP phosphodiesterase CpdA
MRNFVDANAKLSAAIDYLETRTLRPDVVVATGDLTNNGGPAQYELLKELLEPLTIPVYLVPGNHDERESLRSAFCDRPWMPSFGAIDYVIDDYPIRLIGMDTTLPDRHDGLLEQEQLEWLDTQLAAEPDKPTFLFLHHPPFLTNLWMFDAIRLDGGDELRQVIERHSQVVQIVAGHVHRPISYHWGTTVITTCPSTTHQSRCDLHPDEGAGITNEQPMLQFHLWTGQGFITHTTPFEASTKTIEISEVIPDWDAARSRILAGPPFEKGPGGLF